MKVVIQAKITKFLWLQVFLVFYDSTVNIKRYEDVNLGSGKF